MDFKTPVLLALASPGSFLISFTGLTISIAAVQQATEIARRSSKKTGLRNTIPRLQMRPWLVMQRRIWRKSKARGVAYSVGTILEATARVAYAALAGCGGIGIGVLVPAAIVMKVFAGRLESSNQVDLSSIVILTAFYFAGSAYGIVPFLQGLRYSVEPRPTKSPWRIQPVTISPTQASRIERYDLLRSVYLYHRLRRASAMALLIGSLIATSGLQYVSSSEQNVVQSAQDAINLSAELAGVLLAGVTLTLVRKIVAVLMPAPHAVATMQGFLQIARDGGKTHSSDQLTPAERLRERLTEVANLLGRYGRKFDRQSPMHPRATVLIAASQRLYSHLFKVASLKPLVPDETLEVVRQSMIVVAYPTHSRAVEQLGLRTNAFDSTGAPRSEVRTQRLAGHGESRTARFMGVVNRSSAFSGSLWTLFTFVAVLILIATGRLDLLSNIQIQK